MLSAVFFMVLPITELPIESVTERYETLEFGGEVGRAVCGAMQFKKLVGNTPLEVRKDYQALHESARS
jgi:hypothetical protein